MDLRSRKDRYGARRVKRDILEGLSSLHPFWAQYSCYVKMVSLGDGRIDMLRQDLIDFANFFLFLSILPYFVGLLPSCLTSFLLSGVHDVLGFLAYMLVASWFKYLLLLLSKHMWMVEASDEEVVLNSSKVCSARCFDLELACYYQVWRDQVQEVNEMWHAREKGLEPESNVKGRNNGRVKSRSEEYNNDSTAREKK